MKDFIELRRILTIIAGQWWVLVILTAIAAVTSLLVSLGQPRVYAATTTLLVGQSMQSSSVNRTDIQTSADVAKTYAEIALRQPVLNAVVETLKLGQSWKGLQQQVRVKTIEGTQLLEVTAEAPSPAAARATADEVARQLIAISPTTMQNTESATNTSFIRQQLESLKQRLAAGQKRIREIETAIAASPSATAVAQLQGERTALEQAITDWERNYVNLAGLAAQERGANNYLTVIEPAQATRDPVRPRVALDAIIGGAVGLVLALALAFLRDYLDSTVHSPDQFKELLGAAPLAEIGALRGSGRSWFRPGTHGQRRAGSARAAPDAASDRLGRGLVTLERPGSPAAESFRVLRTNIQFAGVDKPLRSLVVTSAVPREGKTFVAANLAVAMAQIGKRVILVDGDLRRPAIHTIFGLPNQAGLANLILSGNLAATGQQISEVPNLTVITSGPLPPNPAELLNCKRGRQVMADLVEHADLVIYDSPPVGVVTDPAILGARVDAVLLVTRANATRRNVILAAKQALQNAGVDRVLPVLNGVVSREMSRYHGYEGRYHRPAVAPDDTAGALQEAQPEPAGLSGPLLAALPAERAQGNPSRQAVGAPGRNNAWQWRLWLR